MMLGLDHLTETERQARETRLESFVRAHLDCDRDIEPPGSYEAALWNAVCDHTDDWSERMALIDAHLCVVVSFGEMMVSKGVFGQRNLESAASLLSEFLVFDRTTNPAHRTSRAKLIRDRLSDVSLGAGERRALRLLSARIDLELGLLEGGRTWKSS